MLFFSSYTFRKLLFNFLFTRKESPTIIQKGIYNIKQLREMKHTKLLILSLVAAMTFSACGTDDSLQFNFPDKENNGGGNTGGGDNSGNSTDKNNSNKNMAKANMPQVLKNALGGLEFPKLKNNGTSYAIVHMDGDIVNFSSEWDDDMKSQRWSCYTFNTTNKASNVDRWKPSSDERKYFIASKI